MEEITEKNQKIEWKKISASYAAVCFIYTIAQPEHYRSTTTAEIIGHIMGNILEFCFFMLVAISVGSIVGVIYKLCGKPFPFNRILKSSLVIVSIFIAISIYGGWYARQHGI